MNQSPVFEPSGINFVINHEDLILQAIEAGQEGKVAQPSWNGRLKTWK